MQVATILSGQGGQFWSVVPLTFLGQLGYLYGKKANPYTKINSNWIKYLNVKDYKAFRKYIEVYLPDFRVGKDFLRHKSRNRTSLTGSKVHALSTVI